MNATGPATSSPLPLVEELSPVPDPWETCLRFTDLPGLIFFDSAQRREHLGQYSFLAADPDETFDLSCAKYGLDPFAAIRSSLQARRTPHIDGLPPFQGGAAGMLGYELGGCFERVAPAAADEFELPVLAVGIYGWVIAWDHRQDRAWIIVQGGVNGEEGEADARAKLQEIRARLKRPPVAATRSITESLPAVAPANAHPVAGMNGLMSNFTRDDYLSAVRRVIEYIHAGDVFQANLSQRLLFPLDESPLDLYGRLRAVNPATFSAYFAWDDWQLCSASPERFLCAQEGQVETRPIKGTRRRGVSPEAELFTGDELRESEKDMAENVMIVDLLRNDLSRVCRAGTVHVPELCRVEVYQTVQHLVSEVRGTLEADADGWDLLRAAFPGGSITGAPKVRAMEIIAELEPTVRGPYCGSLFYLGYDGWMDSSILIRTFIARRGWIQCCVGGGIVAQSDAAAEYAETLDKAAGMVAALRAKAESGKRKAEEYE